MTTPFAHRMTSEKLRPAFGKMVGLWRVHYGFSEVLELLEQKRTEDAAATVVQFLQGLHQAALDGCNWSLAASLLPWEDPLGSAPLKPLGWVCPPLGKILPRLLRAEESHFRNKNVLEINDF